MAPVLLVEGDGPPLPPPLTHTSPSIPLTSGTGSAYTSYTQGLLFTSWLPSVK